MIINQFKNEAYQKGANALGGIARSELQPGGKIFSAGILTRMELIADFSTTSASP